MVNLRRMTPGQKIRAAREARGMSQDDLAKEIGISQPAIKKIESGQTRKSKHQHDIFVFFGIADEPRAPKMKKTAPPFSQIEIASGSIPEERVRVALEALCYALIHEQQGREDKDPEGTAKELAETFLRRLRAPPASRLAADPHSALHGLFAEIIQQFLA